MRRCHPQRTRRRRGNHQGQLLQQLHLRFQLGLRDYIINGRGAEDGINVLHRSPGSARGCGSVDNRWFRGVRVCDGITEAVALMRHDFHILRLGLIPICAYTLLFSSSGLGPEGIGYTYTAFTAEQNVALFSKAFPHHVTTLHSGEQSSYLDTIKQQPNHLKSPAHQSPPSASSQTPRPPPQTKPPAPPSPPPPNHRTPPPRPQPHTRNPCPRPSETSSP